MRTNGFRTNRARCSRYRRPGDPDSRPATAAARTTLIFEQAAPCARRQRQQRWQSGRQATPRPVSVAACHVTCSARLYPPALRTRLRHDEGPDTVDSLRRADRLTAAGLGQEGAPEIGEGADIDAHRPARAGEAGKGNHGDGPRGSGLASLGKDCQELGRRHNAQAA